MFAYLGANQPVSRASAAKFVLCAVAHEQRAQALVHGHDGEPAHASSDRSEAPVEHELGKVVGGEDERHGLAVGRVRRRALQHAQHRRGKLRLLHIAVQY